MKLWPVGNVRVGRAARGKHILRSRRLRFALLWVSDPKSRHSAELEANARVAATVTPDYFDIDDIRGVQISGQARVITDSSERTNARLRLEARYPCLKRLSDGPPALRDAYQRVEFYRLEPTRLVLIDNCRGFGHKETLELGENPTNNREASNPSISADPLVTPTRHANFHDLT